MAFHKKCILRLLIYGFNVQYFSVDESTPHPQSNLYTFDYIFEHSLFDFMGTDDNENDLQA